MGYNSDRHSIRLRGHDYANVGAYFVTVCLNWRIPKILHGGQIDLQQKGQTRRSAPKNFPTFGVVENGVMVLNDCGKMIEKYILEIVNNTDKFSNIKIDEYIVMPDHIHAIITINDPSNATPIQLGTIIQWFKTMTTNEYTTNVKTINWRPFHKKLWQRNYYESIIRNKEGYARIAKYIRNNPILWEKEH